MLCKDLIQSMFLISFVFRYSEKQSYFSTVLLILLELKINLIFLKLYIEKTISFFEMFHGL